MGTGNKVYLNYGVAEGQNLKLIRIAFMKNREVSNLYWEIWNFIMQIHFALHILIIQVFFVYFFFFFFFFFIFFLLLLL